MITDRQIELYRLVEIVGCTMREAGQMVEPPITGERVGQLLKKIYEEKPNLRPRYKGKRKVISYNESMDAMVVEKY